jgi:hypothetical protein
MKMESVDVFNSLEGHLKSTDEIDLVVLREHLILEQCLNALLLRWIAADRLSNPGPTCGYCNDRCEVHRSCHGPDAVVTL